MWLAMIWVACSNDGPNGPPGSSPAATFDDTLAGLEASTARHGDTVLAADQLPDVLDEEDAYWSHCNDDWDMLGTCMDSFMGCDGDMMGGGGMGHGDMGAWHDAMDEMWTSIQDHHDAMAACDTVACCHDEESTWQDHMHGLFDDMDHMDPAWGDDCGW